MSEPRIGTRIERDSMGEMEVPADALWGASTQRAALNFPISGERFPRRFIAALGLVKGAAAAANGALGAVEPALAAVLERAAREVIAGRWDEHFVVDIFQTGSGTSTNMNANEVIATRAHQLLGETAAPVHPNDHVNASQSSNDVMPSALHIAARCAIHEDLLPALRRLRGALDAQARANDDVVKIGRTHLMDATPIRLGQEFGGWARQLALAIDRISAASDGLAELALGGTAVGTGLNCPRGFAAYAIEWISVETGLVFREAVDHFEAQSARDAAVAASAALRGVAVALYKIASDLRLLASGPRCGLAELRLPALQPGSSIMPGKVNPVLCEALIQVAAQVVGNDAAVALGGMTGQLELNAMIPLITRNVLESIHLLATGSAVFAERCVRGIEADRERATELVEQSLAMVTALVPRIGHDVAAELAKEAAATGRTVRALCIERQLLPRAELDALLDARAQSRPDRTGR
jgi:fumarate hydratase class II